MKGPAGVQLERRVDTGWQGRVHPKQRRRVVRLVLVADAESGKLAGISANPICPGPRFNESNLTPKTLRHIETIKERRKCRGQCGALPSLAARDSGLHGATGTLMFSRPDNRSSLLLTAQEEVAWHGRRDRTSRSCRGFVLSTETLQSK